MSDGMDRATIAGRVRCFHKHDPRDCVYCEASHFLESESSEVSRLEMALRHIHSLPIAESDTVKGFAGAVRAHCYQALEPVSEGREQKKLCPGCEDPECKDCEGPRKFWREV